MEQPAKPLQIPNILFGRFGQSGTDEKKSSSPVGKTKRRGRNHIVDAGCRRSNSVGRQVPAASLYLRFRQRTERRPVQFQPLSFLPHRQVHRQLPSGGGKTARILFFQPVRCAWAADYENTPPDWGRSLPSAERVSRSLHKIFNHASASGQIRIAPNGTVLPAEEQP